jgi:uncharacterized membrane protein
MTRALFLSHLREGLSGMPDAERAEIMADYESYFSEGMAKGRSETDIEASLGDPARLAKELNAEAGLKSWEKDRNPKNFLRATLALLGLATIDFFILIPVGFVFLIVTAVILFVFAIIGISGFAAAIRALSGDHGGLSRIFEGLGLISLSIGVGALILMMANWALHQAGRYVRLHYRLLETPND